MTFIISSPVCSYAHIRDAIERIFILFSRINVPVRQVWDRSFRVIPLTWQNGCRMFKVQRTRNKKHKGLGFAFLACLPDTIIRMSKLISVLALCGALTASEVAAELPVKHYLNQTTVRAMVIAAQAEATRRNVHVTLCVVDESGNLLYLEKADGAALNTIQFAQKKARHAAAYGSPSKNAQDAVRSGKVDLLALPDYFPNQGGLPIKVSGELLGGIAASGARSDVDEAIAQAGLDALSK
jgi:glc operon protein GlcG